MKKMRFKLNIKIYLRILILVFSANIVKAQQDPMYTQYFFNSQTINPAYVGTWESIGFTALTRYQWVGWDEGPRTYSFSVQSPMNNEKMALGLNIISDKFFKEKKFGVWGDYSYKIKVSEVSDLRLGLKAGFINYTNNFSEYVLLPDINDPQFYGGIENKFIPNFGMGLFLNNQNYYVGLSIPKLLHKEITDDNPNNYSLQAEFRHYYLEGGLIINLNEDVLFKPTFLAKTTHGVHGQIDLSANFLIREKIWLGAMYRTSNAIGFIAQWIFDNQLRIGYAYDYSTSKLNNYNNGTHEIMVSYELKKMKEMVASIRYF